MKKKLFIFLLMLCLFISPVLAEKVDTNCIGGEDTNCIVISDAGLIEADDEVTYSDNADGSVGLAGNIVTYNGEADGILFAAANATKLNGKSEYLLTAGNDVNINTLVNKDAFIAGNIITFNTTVKRDAYIVGSSLTIAGKIGRDAFFAGNTVELDNVTINGNVKIYASKLTIGSNVTIKGKLTYDVENEAISKSASIGSTEKLESEHVSFKVSYMSTLKFRMLGFASLLVVFAVLALVLPRSISKVAEDDLSFIQIITYIGYALVFLILVPIASVFMMVLLVGFPLALITIGLYILTIYLSYAYTGYFIGKHLLRKMGSSENVLLAGLLGITILELIALIPYVGPIVTLLAYLTGIGIIIFNFKK